MQGVPGGLQPQDGWVGRIVDHHNSRSVLLREFEEPVESGIADGIGVQQQAAIDAGGTDGFRGGLRSLFVRVVIRRRAFRFFRLWRLSRLHGRWGSGDLRDQFSDP